MKTTKSPKFVEKIKNLPCFCRFTPSFVNSEVYVDLMNEQEFHELVKVLYEGDGDLWEFKITYPHLANFSDEEWDEVPGQ